jgi:tetratricopeptide (TPR) repeat protein
MLREGKRREAAAVFEALTNLNPRNAAAWNNRGFCLLPDDPATALTFLEKAANLGYGSRGINAANRTLALFRLGRYATALELVEQATTDVSALRDSAFLWSIESDLPEVIHYDNALAYMVDLAKRSADAAGDSTASRRWLERPSHNDDEPLEDC